MFTSLGLWLAKYAFGRWLQANWRLVLIGLGALAVIGALWAAYSAIYDSGVSAERARWEERQRAAEAKAAADTKLLQSAIAEIDTGVTIDMEAIANVRTIYRDKVRTIAVDVYRGSPACDIPVGLLGEINAAASAYAATATGTGDPSMRPAKPSP